MISCDLRHECPTDTSQIVILGPDTISKEFNLVCARGIFYLSSHLDTFHKQYLLLRDVCQWTNRSYLYRLERKKASTLRISDDYGSIDHRARSIPWNRLCLRLFLHRRIRVCLYRNSQSSILL